MLALGSAVFVAGACEQRPEGVDGHVDGIQTLIADSGLRLGSTEDPAEGFTGIVAVEVDQDGNLYVVEGFVPEIRVYDPEGVRLARIGGPGGGPGEFESPPRIGVVGDTLWAWDGALNRLTLFDRSGTVRSTARFDGVTVPLPSGRAVLLPWRMRADGSFDSHMGRISFSRPGEETGVRPTDSIPVPFVRFDPSGAVIDTVGSADRPPPRMWRPPSQDDLAWDFIEVDGRRQSVPTPPSELPWWSSVPGGYVLVEGPTADGPDDAEVVVTRIGFRRDTVYRRTLRYTPEPYSSEALDTIAARAARGEPGGMVPYSPFARGVPEGWEATARALRQAMDFPPYQSPLQHPWVAHDGAVWLKRWDHIRPEATWILLDPEGRVRGQLVLAADVQPMWAQGDVVWVVEPDEMDVPWLVRRVLREG